MGRRAQEDQKDLKELPRTPSAEVAVAKEVAVDAEEAVDAEAGVGAPNCRGRIIYPL